MPRKSSVTAMLPPADLRDLNAMIGSGKHTLDDLVGWLSEHGYAISRSALHRHGRKVQEVAERMRQSREVTDAVMMELGDSAAQGKQGRLLVEMARTLVFDLLMKLQADDGADAKIDTKDVAFLGKGLADLGRALRLDQDFEMKVRDEAFKAAKAEAAKKLKTAETEATEAGEKGLTADRVAKLRREILGMSR